MKTIICGAGDVGYSIADKLSKENFEVTVIDESEERLSKVSENLDVKTIIGIPSLPSVLLDAGAKDCKILIAVTKSDETNMVTCQIGHSIFKIPKKIARIRQQDYLNDQWHDLYNNNNFPIDAIISPEFAIHSSKKNDKKLSYFFSSGRKITYYLSIPLLIFMFVFADFFLNIIFAEMEIKYLIVCRILIITVLIEIIFSHMDSFLVMSGLLMERISKTQQKKFLL